MTHSVELNSFDMVPLGKLLFITKYTGFTMTKYTGLKTFWEFVSLTEYTPINILENLFEIEIVLECTPHPPLNGALLPWGEFYSGFG